MLQKLKYHKDTKQNYKNGNNNYLLLKNAQEMRNKSKKRRSLLKNLLHFLLVKNAQKYH